MLPSVAACICTMDVALVTASQLIQLRLRSLLMPTVSTTIGREVGTA